MAENQVVDPRITSAITHWAPRFITHGVALGDFNDWAWPGPVQSTLSRVFPEWTSHRTWPSRMPVFKLDRLYCRPKGALVQSFIDTTERFASDHLPLIVDIDPTVASRR